MDEPPTPHPGHPHTLLSPQEAENSDDTESEEGSDITGGSSFDSSDQSTAGTAAAPPEFVQKLLVFAAGLRLLLSAIMTTAGKVVSPCCWGSQVGEGGGVMLF